MRNGKRLKEVLFFGCFSFFVRNVIVFEFISHYQWCSISDTVTRKPNKADPLKKE